MTYRIAFAGAVGALVAALAGATLAQAPDAGLPDGPGKGVMLRACTMCHPVSQIIYKPRAPDDWEDLIGRMIDKGADVTPEEQDALYAYLVKNYGKPAAAPEPGAKAPSAR